MTKGVKVENGAKLKVINSTTRIIKSKINY